MTQNNQLEALGLEMAQRKIISCLAEFARISLQNVSESTADRLVSDLELRLSELRGEYLYPAPPELTADAQKLVNQSFQQAFSELSTKVTQHLRQP